MNKANPYTALGQEAFWSSGVAGSSPFLVKSVYQKKWSLKRNDKIATAGSCFAQHISRYLRKANYNVLDLEPPPPWTKLKIGEVTERVSFDKETAMKFGYEMYSARYGNIYTVHQLLQLLKEAFGLIEPQLAVWQKDGRYYDAFRPNIEPGGLDTIREVEIYRQAHLEKVRELFLTADVFVFTLGLTEGWVHTASQTVYPTAPGTIAGMFDPDVFSFKNFGFVETFEAFVEFEALLKTLRKDSSAMKFLLTVSPVPLTATASGKHVLQATVYSKSVLRAVAGALEEKFDNIDYFPSYEIVTNPANRSTFYNENLRTVRDDAVEIVMKHFFASHAKASPHSAEPEADVGPEFEELDVQCDEYILESFRT